MSVETVNFNKSPLPLEYLGRKVRFVGTPDEPEWVAVDVGDILGIENIRAAIVTVHRSGLSLALFPRILAS